MAQSKKPIGKGGHPSNIPKHLLMSEAVWKKILIAFPEVVNDRIQVEMGLALYRSEQDASRTSLSTKRSLSKVRSYGTKLRDELEKLLRDPVFYNAGRPHWHSRPRPAADDFQPLMEQLEKMQLRMEEAQLRTASAPGRKSTDPIDRLVQYLNWIQARITGDNVIRSQKNSNAARPTTFVHLCCETVGLSKGQIDRALRRNAGEFHKMLKYWDFDTAVGEPIGKRHRPKSKRSRRTPGSYL